MWVLMRAEAPQEQEQDRRQSGTLRKRKHRVNPFCWNFAHEGYPYKTKATRGLGIGCQRARQGKAGNCPGTTARSPNRNAFLGLQCPRNAGKQHKLLTPSENYLRDLVPPRRITP